MTHSAAHYRSYPVDHAKGAEASLLALAAYPPVPGVFFVGEVVEAAQARAGTVLKLARAEKKAGEVLVMGVQTQGRTLQVVGRQARR